MAIGLMRVPAPGCRGVISGGILTYLPKMRSYSSKPPRNQDWSATQYLKFSGERTRPSWDLVAQVPLKSPRSVVDLGCGPGNSTAVLVERFPDAIIKGIDSSPDMVAKAQVALPGINFILDDLSTYMPPREEPVDLLFSNAVFQWIPYSERIPIIKRLIRSQPPGGVFALQVPDNHMEKSHIAMRLVAENGGPWTETLQQLQPSLGPFQTPQEIYDELKPICSSINLWHTYYQHVLDSHEAVVEWVKGTGLRPFIDPLNAEQKAGFLDAYLEKIRQLYPVSIDGKVLLRYPRLFMVAIRAANVQ